MDKHEEQKDARKQEEQKPAWTWTGLAEIEKRIEAGIATPEEIALHNKIAAEINAVVMPILEANREALKELAADLDTIDTFKAAHPEVLAEWFNDDPNLSDEDLLQRIAEYESAAAIPILRAIRPKNYLATIDIISNNLTKNLVNTGKREFDPSKDTKGKYHNYVIVDLDSAEYEIDTDILSRDKQAMNGAHSLYAAGNIRFDEEMIYRTINGLSNTESVSPQSVKAIRKSIRKLWYAHIYINATEEYRARKLIGKGVEKVFEGNILNLAVEWTRTGGVIKPMYYFVTEPILYSYARDLGQISTTPLEMLNIKPVIFKNWQTKEGGRILTPQIAEVEGIEYKAIRNGDQFREIREYLLHRISQMMNEKTRYKKYQPIIKLETFYLETKTNTSKPKYTKTARDQATQCLNFWLVSGYIKGWNFTFSGRSYYGIKIIL